MRSYIFFLLLLASGFTAFTQNEGFDVEIEGYRLERQSLNADISSLVLDFDGACFDDAFGMLPVYTKRIRLVSDQVTVNAVITEAHSGMITHGQMAQVADIAMAGDDFRIHANIIYDHGTPFAEVLLLPFRRPTSTTLEVLDSCHISVEINDAVTGSRGKSDVFVENSVLASGTWYKISTAETGIYRIGFEDLTAMGINPSSLDPRKIRIFGNGNGIVPEKNDEERLDDLLENPIYVHGEADGTFDQDDYILFYGQSAIKWEYVPFQGYGLFVHAMNPYTDRTFYFLNVNDAEGKRVLPAGNQGLTPTVYVSEFSDYRVHENDEVNILKTGREWYGEKFSEQTVYEYDFSFPNICEDYKVSLLTNVAAHSTIESNFKYYYGDELLLTAPVSKIIIGTTVYAWTTTPDTVGFYPSGGDEITLQVEYDKPVSTSLGWMNYISLNARRKLIYTGPFFSFRDHLSFGPDAVAEYKISGAPASLTVWDVTDPFSISRQEGSYAGGNYNFVAPAGQIREYIAFDGSGFNTATYEGPVANQNLHSYSPVEYIILTHPGFMDQAQRMLTLHSDVDGMEGFIVTPDEIYNEFSSGKQDPAAIRDFIRMLYLKADSLTRPKYLLLLGDASYDYKDRVPGNTNLVPTYQSVEALKLGYSFVTDDFFGLLDPGEGVNAWGKSVDIGIGRFPVHSVEQADAMVDKVEKYMTMKPEVFGNWRNDVCFIADDEDQNLHFNQAEKLQQMIDTGYKSYNRPKIYIDAFPQVSSPTGNTYPEVNKAIDNMMQKGSLIVNYTGHGGEGGLAHESILDIPAINSWTNWDRLPLFITATCEFSRFDDPSIISAGEYVFLNPDGGGIGLLTTSRLAWADPNFRLNKAVYQFMFRRNGNGGEYYRIGDIIKLAKTDQNNGTNIKNFVLLGDPAMQLAYPEYDVKTTHINGKKLIGFVTDTLSAMSEVSMAGVITDLNRDTVHDFNGYIFPTVYDQQMMMSTLGNDIGSLPAPFAVPGQKLYEGKVKVVNGLFSFNFFMPQSMVTEIGYARVSYYAYDTVNQRDAHGYQRVSSGGVNEDFIPDNEGPQLSLYIDNTDFVSGGLTDRDPVFLAYLYDEHGINFTGNGIGRDITLTLNGDPHSTVVLNDVFSPDLDSYRSGWLSFPFSDLDDGTHTLTLKAWDNMNNASEKTIEFEVSVNTQIALTNVMNYPNPFTDNTYFVFNHNKPGNNFDVEIEIYNISGQLVQLLRSTTPAEGMSVSPVAWDGTGLGGNRLGKGIYIYRIFVTDEQGTQYVQTSKLIFAGKQ